MPQWLTHRCVSMFKVLLTQITMVQVNRSKNRETASKRAHQQRVLLFKQKCKIIFAMTLTITL
jgi:hypothetical protein